MAPAANNHSPFADSSFNDGWAKADSSSHKNNNGGGPGTMTEFNAIFHSTSAEATLDPRFVLNSAPSPNSQYDPSLTNSSGVDRMFGFRPSSFSPYGGSDFGVRTSNSPYYHYIETNPAAVFRPSPLRNIYRRSVSEPPGVPLIQQQQAPAVTFHRENHYLGKPMPQKPMPSKSLPKQKRSRQYPYPPTNMGQQDQHQQQEQRFQPQHRRVQTRPGRSGPTSAPLSPVQQQHAPQLTAQDLQLLSTSLYMPTPEGFVASPVVFDPTLSAMPSQSNHMPRQVESDPKSVLTIPLTVDELRAIILDAVQKAVDGERVRQDPKSGVAEGVGVADEAEKGVADVKPCVSTKRVG